MGTYGISAFYFKKVFFSFPQSRVFYIFFSRILPDNRILNLNLYPSYNSQLTSSEETNRGKLCLVLDELQHWFKYFT